ncbi:MAG: hypothetical protein ACHQK9_17405 [Reyranellales bacterium]
MDGMAVATVLVFAGVFGWLGWRGQTRRLHRRQVLGPYVVTATDRREQELARLEVRKRHRLVVTAAYVIAGAVLGVVAAPHIEAFVKASEVPLGR